MNDTASFGYWVRRWRKALDLTQEQLAEQVACAVVTVKKIEMDERRPSRQMAERLAVTLNVPESQRAKFIQVALGERPAYTLYLPEKPVSPTHAASKIPAPLTRLIGRRAEVDAIKDCVRREDVRLVTLSGPGGVGKTRLAMQVAQELSTDFKDGVFFVSLAPLNDPELVTAAIAQTIEARQVSGKSLKESLFAHLADQATLLVLDNFEHLLPASLFISELLASTSSLKVLSTSRTPLHLYGERRFIIQPFDLPDATENISVLEQNDAIALFVERAQAAQADFRLTKDNASFVAQICSRLDGLPLALELAAARMSVLSPRELLNHLESRLPLLTEGPRDVPLRQQTLTNTIAWSYELLAQIEKTVFERLSVFRGGGTLEAIESICFDMESATVIHALSVLVDQSLVQRHEINGETRFTVLETIREFSSVQLESKGETDAVRGNHLAYYLQLAQRAEPLMTGKEEAIWFDRFDVDLDNIRAALDWAYRDPPQNERREAAALLAASLWFYWYCRAHLYEAREWLERALKNVPQKGKTRAKVLNALGVMTWQQGDYKTALSYYEESIPIWRDENDLHGLAEALHIAGHVVFEQREYQRARAFFLESLEHFRSLNDENLIAPLIGDLGMVAEHLADYAAARDLYEDSLAWYRKLENEDGIAENLLRLGDLASLDDRYDRATAFYSEAFQLSCNLEISLQIASALHKLGRVALHNKNAEEAEKFFLDSLKIQRESGNKQGIAECLGGLAGVELLQGKLERAVKLFGAARALLESIGAPLAPADRLAWERDEKSLRAQIHPEALESAWETGKAIPLEKILDEVMG